MPCTSLMNNRKATRVCPPWLMPNSFACLTALMVSPPALARPITLDLEFCACSRNEAKSEVPSGCLLEPSLAAVLLDVVGGFRLDALAERVVDRDEVPVLAAACHHRR